MNKNIILSAVILAIIVLSFFAGIFYQEWAGKNVISPAEGTDTKLTDAIKSRNLTVSTRGYVKNISSRTLSIYHGAFNIDIPIKAGAKIYSQGGSSSSSGALDFSDIKIGDLVTISLSFDSRGEPIGESLIVSYPDAK